MPKRKLAENLKNNERNANPDAMNVDTASADDVTERDKESNEPNVKRGKVMPKVDIKSIDVTANAGVAASAIDEKSLIVTPPGGLAIQHIPMQESASASASQAAAAAVPANAVAVATPQPMEGVVQIGNTESLSAYVKAGNKQKVQEAFRLIKAKSDNWRYVDRVVNDAVRDAIQWGHFEIVKLFIDEGVSGNAYAHSSGSDGCVEPLISFAAKKGDIRMVRLLVENHADIKPRDDYYRRGDDSAIIAAIEGGFDDVTEYLLDHGANAHGTIGRGRMVEEVCSATFLGKAAFDGKIAVVNSLVKYGADVKKALKQNYLRTNDLVNKHDNEHRRNYKESYLKNLTDQKDNAINRHLPSTRILMDYAIGVDLSENDDAYDENIIDNINLFKNIDVSGINFIGVSLDGKPITHEVLRRKRILGADKAITTLNELNCLHVDAKIAEEKNRLQRLVDRIEISFKQLGKLVDEKGHVNFVPLNKSAEVGDVAAVKTRIAAGIDPNKEKTIVTAAKMGHIEVVKLLADDAKFDKTLLLDAVEAAKSDKQQLIVDFLSTKQDVNQPDEKGNTPLHRAAKAGNFAEVQSLISRGANVNLTNEIGATALSYAASKSFNKEAFREKESKDHINIIELLLNNGADANTSCYGYTPLYNATSAGSSKAVQLLLPKTNKTPTPIFKPFSDHKIIGHKPWYQELMFEAIRSPERVAILTALKAHGADFSEKESDRDGTTLLHTAMTKFPSSHHIASTMRDLRFAISGCEERFPVSQLSKEQQRLIEKSIASFKKHLAYVDFLLQNGADPKVTDNHSGATPLHTLLEKIDLDHIDNGYDLVIDRCLQKGFDINAKDKYGRTLLHTAASHDRIEAVKCLLARGADIDAIDEDRRTPLYLAAGNPETTKLLITRGAKCNVKDKEGKTPHDFSVEALAHDEKRYKFNTSEARNEFRKPYQIAQMYLKDHAHLKNDIKAADVKMAVSSNNFQTGGGASASAAVAAFVAPSNAQHPVSKSFSVAMTAAAASITPAPAKAAVEAKQESKEEANFAIAAKVAELKALGKVLDDIKDEYTCPLSLGLIIDPVILADGITYDRDEVNKYFDRHKNAKIIHSPSSNTILKHLFITPNVAIRDKILIYLENEISKARQANASIATADLNATKKPNSNNPAKPPPSCNVM